MEVAEGGERSMEEALEVIAKAGVGVMEPWWPVLVIIMGEDGEGLEGRWEGRVHELQRV